MSAKTQIVIKTTKPNSGDKAALEARAARFKLLASNTMPAPGSATSTTAVTSSSSKAIDPAEAEKLAKRAARFADVNAAPAISTTGKVSTTSATTNIVTSSVVDAERLAKRAARFANIPK